MQFQTEKKYTLKKRTLKRWIYDQHLTQPYVAKRLGMETETFKRKLREREPFEREQIRALIYLMGARDAFDVIYFPSNKQRRRIYTQVFGWWA